MLFYHLILLFVCLLFIMLNFQQTVEDGAPRCLLGDPSHPIPGLPVPTPTPILS